MLFCQLSSFFPTTTPTLTTSALFARCSHKNRPTIYRRARYCFADSRGVAYELFSCKLRCGDDTQLLHHAELVKDAPAFGNLAIRKSVYDYPGDSG
jgi:hypothetical protein